MSNGSILNVRLADNEFVGNQAPFWNAITPAVAGLRFMSPAFQFTFQSDLAAGSEFALAVRAACSAAVCP